MIPGFVEISQESVALAEAEAVSAAEALGGRAGETSPSLPILVPVEVPEVKAWKELADRLALARRCLVSLAASPDLPDAATAEGRRGGSGAFRRIGRPSGSAVDEAVLECGRAFKAGGGRIDLAAPDRRYWLVREGTTGERLLEEVASVDRSGPAGRTMPQLPFRRPVSLPPRLARAAVNLARVRPADRVLDPFLGTGALLAEAGLVGGTLYGIDRNPEMVRGALRNLAHLGVGAQELLAGDARTVDFHEPQRTFSAIVTDPPYGRSSSTGGEETSKLVDDVVSRWWERLVPEGRLLVIVPTGAAPLSVPKSPRFHIPVRVHRSLTREFFLYERSNVRRSSD